MAYYEGHIPAEDLFKKLIGEGLIEAEQAANEHFFSLPTKCGKEQYVWNLRYKKILIHCVNERYLTVFCKKNRWDYMPIFDIELDSLYILLNQNRFNELVKRPEKDKRHYAKSPAVLNADLDQYDTVYEQMCLWDVYESDSELSKFRQDDLGKIENCFGRKAKRYVIITFKPNAMFGITSLSANLVDSRFRLKKSESWDEFIPTMQPIEPVLDGEFQDTQGVTILDTTKRIDSKPIIHIAPVPKILEDKNQ